MSYTKILKEKLTKKIIDEFIGKGFRPIEMYDGYEGCIESDRIATKVDGNKMEIVVVNRALSRDMVHLGYRTYTIDLDKSKFDIAYDVFDFFSRNAISKKEAEGLMAALDDLPN